jgi:hypothetical protein
MQQKIADKSIQFENFQVKSSISYLDSKYLLSTYIDLVVNEIKKCLELINNCKIAYSYKDDAAKSEYPCVSKFMQKARDVCQDLLEKIKTYALVIFINQSSTYCLPALALNVKAIGKSLLSLNDAIENLIIQYHQSKIVCVASELSRLSALMIFIEVAAQSPKDDIYYQPPESPDWGLLKSVLRVKVYALHRTSSKLTPEFQSMGSPC